MTLRSTLLRTPLLALLPGLAGCAMMNEADYAALENGDFDRVSSGFLRLDVYPSDRNADLLPQTVLLDEEWVGLEVEIETPVLLEGVIEGFDAAPHLAASVPGEDMPVEAVIAAWVPGTVMAGATVSAEDGAYRLQVPSAEGYRFTVVPSRPAELPFLVESLVDVSGGEGGGDIYLDYGVPIHGRVTTSDGLPLVGAKVQAVDAATGVGGPILETDPSGWYLLRVFPGDYLLVVTGEEGSYIPTTTLAVWAEPEQGATQDVVFGAFDPITVEGDVSALDEGLRVDNIEVRFTATALDDHPAASLEVATNTDQYGNFSARLLPGRYLMEVVPPCGTALSPLQRQVEVGRDAIQTLDPVDLEGFVPIASQVLDPTGSPLPGVQVSAAVQGFAGCTYTAFTDEVGYFTLDVPHVKTTVTLTPPDDDSAVTWLEYPIDAFPDQVALVAGRRIEGVVRHDGEPVAYAAVEVRDDAENLYATATTDADGRFDVRVDWDARVNGAVDEDAVK